MLLRLFGPEKTVLKTAPAFEVLSPVTECVNPPDSYWHLVIRASTDNIVGRRSKHLVKTPVKV